VVIWDFSPITILFLYFLTIPYYMCLVLLYNLFSFLTFYYVCMNVLYGFMLQISFRQRYSWFLFKFHALHNLGAGSHAKANLFGYGNQVIWVWLVCQNQVNMGSMQLFYFKNNKTILKYQNAPYDYKKLQKQ
jgi:hypothetical protein